MLNVDPQIHNFYKGKSFNIQLIQIKRIYKSLYNNIYHYYLLETNIFKISFNHVYI
jgi:hypothetical protein